MPTIPNPQGATLNNPVLKREDELKVNAPVAPQSPHLPIGALEPTRFNVTEGLEMVSLGEKAIVMPGTEGSIELTKSGVAVMKAPNVGPHCWSTRKHAWNSTHQAAIIATAKEAGVILTPAQVPIADAAMKKAVGAEVDGMKKNTSAQAKAVVAGFMARTDVMTTRVSFTKNAKGVTLHSTSTLQVANVSAEEALRQRVTELESKLSKYEQPATGKSKAAKRKNNPASAATIDITATTGTATPTGATPAPAATGN